MHYNTDKIIEMAKKENLDDECYDIIFNSLGCATAYEILPHPTKCLQKALEHCDYHYDEKNAPIAYFLARGVEINKLCFYSACKNRHSADYAIALMDEDKFEPDLKAFKLALKYQNNTMFHDRFKDVEYDQECLDMLCQAKKVHIDLVNKILEKTEPTYEHLLMACKTDTDYAGTNPIIVALLDRGIAPTIECFKEYLQRYVYSPVVKAFIDHGIVVEEECFKIYIKEQHDVEVIKTFVEGGLVLTDKLYDYLLAIYDEKKGNESYMAIVEYLLRQNIKPRPEQIVPLFKFVNNYYIPWQNKDNLKTIITEMVRLEIPLTDDMLDFLLAQKSETLNQFLMNKKLIDLDRQLEMACYTRHNLKAIEELIESGAQITMKCLRNASSNKENLMVIKYLAEKGDLNPDSECMKAYLEKYGDRTSKYLAGFI